MHARKVNRTLALKNRSKPLNVSRILNRSNSRPTLHSGAQSSVFVTRALQKNSALLRTHIVRGFKTSDSAHAQFHWQYWHVDGHYTHLRTPALGHLPQTLIDPCIHEIARIAQVEFGCAELSPPWVSLYTDGCFQNWHADVPHGPWGFVLSLTQDPSGFQGGRTLILKPETLDYWPRLGHKNRDCHVEDLVESHALNLGQLLVFDARRPHSVEMIRGAKSPTDGRMVVHGWFTRPRPFIKGERSLAETLAELDAGIGGWVRDFAASGIQWDGVASLRIKIAPSGKLQTQILASTLVDLEQRGYVEINNSKFLKKLLDRFKKMQLSPRKSASVLTLPFDFSAAE